jgi:N-formylglutamate amidohydrolase
VRDGRFTGGYITRRYGSPSDNVNALQLEVAQCAYMDEADPRTWSETRARRLLALIDRLIPALTEWAQARVGR